MMLFLSMLSPVFPLVAGWHRRYSCLWYYVLAGLLSDTTVSLFKHLLHWNYYWLGNVFLITEFLLLNGFYRSKVFKRNGLFLFIIIFFCGVFIIHTLLYCNYGLSFNYLASSCSNFYFIILSICGFYRLLEEKKMVFLEQSTFFWANVAVLIYASGNFFIFLLRNNVEASDPKMMMILWTTVFLSLNILKNILLGVALSKKQ